MKQIFKNRYLKSFAFSSHSDATTFMRNQRIDRILSFEETYGDFTYCYICYHSLTSKKEFALSFSSDKKEENLNLLFWNDAHLIVLDTGTHLYLIDEDIKATSTFDITTPIVGLYITQGNNLLVLEEASFRLIDKSGQILTSALFDLIENFSLEENTLCIFTSDERKTFKLS